MSDQSEQQNPFRSRRFVLSMVIVAVIALLAVIVLVSNLLGGKDETAPTASPLPSTTAVPVDSDPSSCGLEGYETTASLTDAPDTTWTLVGTVAAPSDPEGSGPGVTDSSGFRSCYAHTAEGALFAAANYVALGTDATMYDKMSALVAPGPGRDALIAMTEGADSGASSDRAQVAGFAINSFDEKAATVDLALNYNDGQMVSLPIKLVWSAGDWKIVVADDGSMPIAPAALNGLGGYTPWSGA
ncbi:MULTISPECIES: hypothetical protein [Cryobacterium]|nr:MULTISPECIES: hypothetical protein [Cryobacterium]TFC56814.1 hypothetical protein E3O60_16825 [Cryobacterium sp. TMB1-7]TFC57903.1 hypothetical protein E3O68_02540 [Cryobacterium sp. TMB3-1-2]TFC70098.1 hypothetical protein E3T21_11035 [Cryobacterium sp. TMB3-15]TFC75468.1 hypothetical protein E3T22_12655 [Cryobacterium sp. TMB3-10]TFD38851.1 hypothetical protein E3T58_16215 [Cryobacterium sp. TMB3-12]